MNRIEALQKRMLKENVDCAIITDSNTIFYFLNKMFHTGERFCGLIVHQSGECQFFIHEMFPCEIELPGQLVRFSDTDKVMSIVAQYVSGTVAVDKYMDAHFLLELTEFAPANNYITGYVVDKLKAVKSEEEIRKMMEASRLNDAVMDRVRELIQIGKSEKQLADEIEAAFMEIAHSAPSFETIIAYGDHGSDCHAVPSDRVLKEGENVIVDMGCFFEGYCSDMTRTFFVNNNPEKEIYDTVLKANLAGIAAVKAGVKFSDIDAAARAEIEKAGYGQYFIHRLGHGIGMDVHEPFDVSGSDDIIVEEGMCFSIEPGIYIPGRVGVRIEDLVCATKDGCIVLNKHPKDQEILKR